MGPRSFICALLLATIGCGDRPFSSTEWKSLRAERKEGSALVTMAHSLVRERTLVGKSSQEVTELLGLAQETSESDFRWEWILDSSMNSDVTVLEVEFDATGKVTSAAVNEWQR